MQVVSLNSTANTSLGTDRVESNAVGAVRRLVIQVVDVSSMSTSFLIKARLVGLADAELISVPYTNRGTGASVAAGTAITAEGLFEVDGTGVEVVLVNTYTSGSGTAYVVPCIG